MGYRIQFLSFFFKNRIPSNLNPKNWFRGQIFPISVVLLGQLFPKTIGFNHERTRTKHMNFMKICWKLWFVSSLVIHYINILTLRICTQGPPKRKTWPPPPSHLFPSEVEAVRIVVISFRNIAKKNNLWSLKWYDGNRATWHIWVAWQLWYKR